MTTPPFTQDLSYERSTKHTHVYVAKPGAPVLIRTIYIDKAERFGGNPPAEISITIASK